MVSKQEWQELWNGFEYNTPLSNALDQLYDCMEYMQELQKAGVINLPKDIDDIINHWRSG
jgi:hypothetical protein